MKIGVIADDFTGATDIAGFLVAGGLTTTQMIGVPDADAQVDADAVVISLKSRSNPAADQANRVKPVQGEKRGSVSSISVSGP